MAQINAVPLVQYANTILSQMKANSGWLTRLNNTAEIPSAATAGAISVPIITRATAADPVDGTPLTNAAARTLQTLTLVDKVVAATLAEQELQQWTPDTAAAYWKSGADAIINACETAVITAYMAGTAYNTTTLAAGQNNFFDDGTDAEMRANIKKLNNALATIMGVTGQDSPDNYAILLPAIASPTTDGSSWANFTSNAQIQSQLRWDQPLNAFRWAGVPIYGVNVTATGWGLEDGGTAAIVAHRDSMAVAFPRLRIVPPRDNDSGFVQTELKGAYGYGLLNTGTSTGTWAEILNAST
jgi:hypothetical protein